MYKRVHFTTLLIVSLVVAMLVLPAISAAAGLHITKAASPTSLTVAGPVKYTYVVWYDGQTWVNNLKLTDDKLGIVPLPSTSDTSTPGFLYPGEIFTYNATATVVSVTTTNVATVTGRENDETTITANATATVTVSKPATATVTGGHIPHTGSPWYGTLVLGIALTLAGIAGVVVVSRRRHA